MTDYLRLAQERAPSAPSTPQEQDNPYLSLAREQQTQQQSRARTVIETALRDDPELAAERRRLSQTSGLAPDVVQRNLEELRVKEQARAIDLARMAQDSPILYRQLTDPNFTTTAIDDLGTLGNLERSVGRAVNRAMQYATGRDGLAQDAARGVVDVGLGATAGVGEMIFNVAGALNDVLGWRAGAEGARRVANRSKQARDELGFQPESSTGQAVKAGLQSSGTNLAILPLGLSRALFSTANQAAAAVAGVMSTGVGADAYMRAREQDRTRAQALQYAIPEGVFEFVFERIPASKLFGDIAANTGLLRTLGKQVVSEGWTEQVTTLAQDFNEWMNLNQSKTLAEFINERPEAAYQTFIATLVGVGVQTSTIHGINKIVERASNQSLVFEQDLLQEQMKLAAASMLRNRSPEQFRAHVQRVVDANEGATAEIYVDAEVLNQLPDTLLAQLPDSVRESLPDALDSNSTVAIPMADVLTIAPGTELEQILNDNARMRPNAPSRLEGELAAKMIEEDAARVLAQAADTAAWQQSTQTVQDAILGELNTAGRFTADVNEAYARLQAAFFSTMAARVNMTPEALYERYRLRVAARQPGGGGQVLNAQGAPAVAGWTPKRVNRLIKLYGTDFRPDNSQAYATMMSPQDFLNLTASEQDAAQIEQETAPLDQEQLAGEVQELYLDIEPDGNGGFRVTSHEGRHRMTALARAGVTQVPVVLNVGSAGRGALTQLAQATLAPQRNGRAGSTVSNLLPITVNNRQALEEMGRGADVLFQSLTTMVPTTKGAVINPTDVKVPGLEAADQPGEKSQKAFEANVNTFDKKVQEIAGKPKRGYDSIKVEGDTPRERAESIITQMVRNLRTIFNAIPEAIRQRSKLWYDGANRISLAFADRYNLTPMQTAGQLAVTSPQADWYMNVSYVERINDILAYRQDHTWDAEMEAWAEGWINSDTQVEGRAKEAERRQEAIREAVRAERAAQRAVAKARSDLEKNTPRLEAKIAEAEAALAESDAQLKSAKKTKDEKAIAKAQKLRDKRNDEAKVARGNLRAAKSAISKAETVLRKAGETIEEKRAAAAEPDANLAVQPLVRGKKLSELTTDFERAWWVRAYDEAHNPRSYRVVSPEGGFLDFAKLDDGTTNDSIGWKSFSAIAKAISIHRDGSVANINAQLGGEHKVRNFYNNIFDPNSATPFVTSDTHQVAANLFLPLGADALEVGQNFGGTGSKSVGATGLNGTYWLYHEAVVRAARDEKVKPREMQSISWEAIRNLFSPSFKADPDSVTAVRDLWVKYQNGQATYDDTVRDVVALAGGRFRDPAWVGVRPDSTAAPEDGSTSYESGLAHARSGDQRRDQPGLGDQGVLGQSVSAGVLTQPARASAPTAANFRAAQWEEATEDMVTADLGNGWTATLVRGDEGGAELSILDPRGVDFGESVQFASFEEAMTAMPEIAARRVGDGGQRVGAPWSEGVLNQSAPGPLGFYSALSRFVASGTVRKAPAAQWIGTLKNTPGVKAEELEATGLTDWLNMQQGTVSREAVLEYLNANGVQVEETQRRDVYGIEDALNAALEGTGYRADGPEPGQAPEDAEFLFFDSGGDLFYLDELPEDVQQIVERTLPSASEPARFGHIRRPGGTNYREVILRLPGDKRYGHAHWPRVDNPLAHVRMSDRLDTDGKRVLVIEEVQSDWGQEGRKRGFNNPRRVAEIKETAGETYPWQAFDQNGELIYEGKDEQLTREIAENIVRRDPQKISSAPFVANTESWLTLALKRITLLAAQEGYDRVSFITGEESVKLNQEAVAQSIDAVTVRREESGKYSFSALKKGKSVRDEQSISRERLALLFGKAGGEQLARLADAKPGEDATLNTYNLSVGGSGLRDFYDNILPATLNKLLRKIGGGRVGEVRLAPTPGTKLSPKRDIVNAMLRYGMGDITLQELNDEVGFELTESMTSALDFDPDPYRLPDYRNIARGVADNVIMLAKAGKATINPGFDITPQMREMLASTGLPLFQAARGTFSPEQMMITLGETADLSTFLHESGHFFLEVLADLASQPDAPAQIRDDMQRVLAWFGVPDLATWNGYTLDQKRPHHERWAESFEQYLFEGKAPNQDLQPLFRRFRSWLVNVYSSLKSFMRGRDLKLNSEVRQVFDRLLATDEQIAQAEEAAGMLPDFEATNEAIEALQARSLRDLKWTVKARGRALKALEKEAAGLRKEVEAEVRAEVEQQPLYAAMRWLRRGEMTNEAGEEIKAEKGFRLDTAVLAEMYPESMLARPDLAGLKGMTAKAGLHPDLVADMFGFASGDRLVRDILAAEPIGSVIEGITDQRMLERYGDIATPEAREAAANEAVHNEARARSLATELKSQAEMMNQRQDTGRTDARGRPITVNAVVEAAKQFALNLAARRKLKDLKNAAWQHRAAEARAGRAWQKLTAEGKSTEAVQAKRDQVLNNAAVKALQDAQADVRKSIEFFRRVAKGNNEKVVKGGRDPDVVNAMRAILGAYGVAPRLEKSALAYMDVVAKNDPAMYAALKPSVDGALLNAKPFEELTVEELRGLTDELRAMWVLAKRSRQMEVDGNLLDIEDAAGDLLARMETIGVPDKVPGEAGAITDKEERGIQLRFALSFLTRVEQWAERLDGAFGGPFLRLVFQPVKDAADRFRTDRVNYRKRYQALLENLGPILPPGPIEAPELGYTFGNARDSGTAELLHAIIHTGNDSNKRKLLLGRRWATENADGTLDTTRWDNFINRLANEGRLEKAHFDFAQGVWDLLEQTKPLAQETHRKVFGRYFAEVTANPVVTPFGTYRGGYAPAQTDPRLVQDSKLRELAEAENESMAYAFPSSPSGFTKARVEYNKPLMLDLRTLAQHMDKVLLFSHMQGAVTDVRRLLTNKKVAYALNRIDPGAYEGMLIPWLNRAAKQVVETPVAGDRKISRFLGAARSRAGMALMMANLSNTAQQITGFSMAAVKVKPGLLMKAASKFISDPKAMQTVVADASPYMKDRMLNEVAAMNDAVEDILVNPTMLERGQAWTRRHAYFMQAAVDNAMSPIVWTAAYNQAIAQKMSERDAVRFADGVVRQTQGTTLPEDISRFESGPAYGRLFTQFVSYFNMMANTNATAVSQIVEEMGLRKGAGKVLYVAIAGLLAPIWVAEAIAQAFRGGPEDEDDDGYLDDWLLAVFGLGTLRGLVAQVPIVGQAAQLAVNRFNSNPADDRFSLSPAVSLIESTVSAPASVYNAIVNEGSAQKAVRDVAAAATMVTGLPIYAAARPLGYAAGMADDRIEPTGPVDVARGLITGTASPASKVP